MIDGLRDIMTTFAVIANLRAVGQAGKEKVVKECEKLLEKHPLRKACLPKYVQAELELMEGSSHDSKTAVKA
eukprot:4177026-Amphidinium_carterae.1